MVVSRPMVVEGYQPSARNIYELQTPLFASLQA